MQFKPILDALETVIKANDAANGLIAVYRKYAVEPGVYTVPVCVIGSSRSLKLDGAFTGDSGGARPRLWSCSIEILVLSRRYPLPDQILKAAEDVDACQAAIFTALNADSTQGGKMSQSWINGVREIVLLNGEYYGYSIEMGCEVFEP